MRTRPTVLLTVTAALVIVLGACASTTVAKTSATTTADATPATPTTQGPETAVAGDVPDNQAFVAYTPAGGGYTIKVPEGWARTGGGSATVFSDKFNTIRIESVPVASAPTVASVTSADLPAISQAARGYVAGKVSSVARTAGEAILATYRIDGASSSVTNKTVRLDVERYVFWKNGKAVVVTLFSPAGSDNVDPWKTVTDGFAWAG